MLKIFFASHGPLASGMEESLKIFGNYPQLTVFAAYVDQRNLSDILDAYYQEQVKDDDEVLLCSDIYCGSVNQVMYRYLDHPHTRLVTGVHFPVMLSVVNEATLSDDKLQKLIDDSRSFLRQVTQDTETEKTDNDADNFF